MSQTAHALDQRSETVGLPAFEEALQDGGRDCRQNLLETVRLDSAWACQNATHDSSVPRVSVARLPDTCARAYRRQRQLTLKQQAEWQ